MADFGTTRRRLETQGFLGLSDADLAEVGPWLRLTPAVCAVFMGLGTALGSTAILWGLAAPALLGAVFPVHPFDLVYNAGLRRLTGTRRLPRSGLPRRFACGMAAAWLLVTGAAFWADAAAAGYLLGGVLTAVAALVSLTHVCIPSMVFGVLFARERRSAVDSQVA
jgi:hypothetical protein